MGLGSDDVVPSPKSHWYVISSPSGSWLWVASNWSGTFGSSTSLLTSARATGGWSATSAAAKRSRSVSWRRRLPACPRTSRRSRFARCGPMTRSAGLIEARIPVICPFSMIGVKSGVMFTAPSFALNVLGSGVPWSVPKRAMTFTNGWAAAGAWPEGLTMCTRFFGRRAPAGAATSTSAQTAARTGARHIGIGSLREEWPHLQRRPTRCRGPHGGRQRGRCGAGSLPAVVGQIGGRDRVRERIREDVGLAERRGVGEAEVPSQAKRLHEVELSRGDVEYVAAYRETDRAPAHVGRRRRRRLLRQAAVVLQMERVDAGLHELRGEQRVTRPDDVLVAERRIRRARPLLPAEVPGECDARDVGLETDGLVHRRSLLPVRRYELVIRESGAPLLRVRPATLVGSGRAERELDDALLHQRLDVDRIAVDEDRLRIVEPPALRARARRRGQHAAARTGGAGAAGNRVLIVGRATHGVTSSTVARLGRVRGARARVFRQTAVGGEGEDGDAAGERLRRHVQKPVRDGEPLPLRRLRTLDAAGERYDARFPGWAVAVQAACRGFGFRTDSDRCTFLGVERVGGDAVASLLGDVELRHVGTEPDIHRIGVWARHRRRRADQLEPAMWTDAERFHPVDLDHVEHRPRPVRPDHEPPRLDARGRDLHGRRRREGSVRAETEAVDEVLARGGGIEDRPCTSGGRAQRGQRDDDESDGTHVGPRL